VSRAGHGRVVSRRKDGVKERAKGGDGVLIGRKSSSRPRPHALPNAAVAGSPCGVAVWSFTAEIANISFTNCVITDFNFFINF